jgi:hypothetical protein
LSQSPILKALSSIRKSGARTLLMGGQACVFYGAAEFSRDLDLLILSDADNLGRIRSALASLDAEVIAVPPFEERHLLRGHAVHFRCRRPDVAVAIEDLVRAKKTQRDKEPRTRAHLRQQSPENSNPPQSLASERVLSRVPPPLSESYSTRRPPTVPILPLFFDRP